jgi:hypothetical protein
MYTVMLIPINNMIYEKHTNRNTTYKNTYIQNVEP